MYDDKRRNLFAPQLGDLSLSKVRRREYAHARQISPCLPSRLVLKWQLAGRAVV